MPSLPADAGLQDLINKAIADLSNRSSIPEAEITFLDATAVVWPDSSLGCAQEGLMYLPALTPGYLIRLAALDQEYEYHTDQGSQAIYCISPSPPIPGMPVDR